MQHFRERIGFLILLVIVVWLGCLTYRQIRFERQIMEVRQDIEFRLRLMTDTNESQGKLLQMTREELQRQRRMQRDIIDTLREFARTLSR